MVSLVLLDLPVNLEVLQAVVEIFHHLLNIVVAGALTLLSLLQLGHLLLDVTLEALTLQARCFVLAAQLLGLRAVLHELAGVIVVVALELLELAPLLEESLRGSTTLVLQDLLFLKVSSLGTLNEFVAVVLVTHLKVIKSV